MLAQRTSNILKIIVGEYVSMARPVGSAAIARRYGLGVSPATIRHEMAWLEEEGYIVRRHISGGGIPSDKGYRYYVESIAQDELPLEEQRMISHLFHQVEMELAEWTHLAAAMLSRMVHNVAIVTFPKALSSRIKHLELIALQDTIALLILLLEEAKLEHHLISFDEAVSQEELSVASRKLNALLRGLTLSQLLAQREGLSPLEEQVRGTVVQIMAAEDECKYEEPYIQGLSHILAQPEFAHVQDMLGVMDVLESKDLIRTLLPDVLADSGVRVVIGEENSENAMKVCSMVITQYGVPGEVNGALGVIGPTRMPYGRTISWVRYMGSLMSSLVAEIYSGPGRQSDGE